MWVKAWQYNVDHDLNAYFLLAIKNKTRVINDPLSQSTVPGRQVFPLILKICDVRTEGWMDNLCENSYQYRS